MNKLTIREKVLLYLLVLTLLLTGGVYFLIMPQFDRYSASVEQVNDEQLKYIQIRRALGRVDAMQSQLSAATDNLNAVVSTYHPILSAVQIDTLITTMAAQHGVVPQKLQIGQARSIVLAPFGTIVSSKTAVPDATSPDSSETNANHSEQTAGTASMLARAVQLTGIGTLNNVTSLAGDMSTNPSLAVSSYTVSPPTANQPLHTLTIYAEVLMYDRDID